MLDRLKISHQRQLPAAKVINRYPKSLGVYFDWKVLSLVRLALTFALN